MRRSPPRGRFIVLEGIDGAGTTTQCRMLAEWLRERGYEAVETREPSGGDVGRLLRAKLAEPEVDPRTMALLFTADRMDHVRREVEPALAAGRWVVCDRYVLSTLAYQGVALDMRRLAALNREARKPDLTLWLDLDLDVAWERLEARWAGGGAREVYEQREFLQKVLHNYRIWAARHPSPALVRIPANLPLDEATACVRQAVTDRFRRYFQ